MTSSLPAFAISKTTFADRAKSKGPPTSGTDARFALASWLPLAATFAYHSRAFAKSCGPPMLPARGSKAQETLSQVVDLSHSSRSVSLRLLATITSTCSRRRRCPSFDAHCSPVCRGSRHRGTLRPVRGSVNANDAVHRSPDLRKRRMDKFAKATFACSSGRSSTERRGLDI